ncbi:hypothetical protein R6Q59_036096 [Mikania micrantha]
MAWFSGKVSLGNFADIAGAVNKLSESVKNIEKNFDSALGFEEKASGATSTTEGEDDPAKSMEKVESSGSQSSSSSQEKEGPKANNIRDFVRKENLEIQHKEQNHPSEIDISEKPPEINIINSENSDVSDKPLETNVASSDNAENVAEKSNIAISDEVTTSAAEVDSQADLSVDHAEQSEFVGNVVRMDDSEVGSLNKSIQEESTDYVEQVVSTSELNEVHPAFDFKSEEASHEEPIPAVEVVNPSFDGQTGTLSELNEGQSITPEEIKVSEEGQLHLIQNSDDVSVTISEVVTKKDDSSSMAELEKVTREMKMMETALLGAARQAQAKADEIAKLMHENEQLKSIVEEQRVYALTKERDTLRREQNKKSDAAALLKEKDEIITQIMAEGEGLSKKQAAQESQIRKLRAQIRELEEEKKGLMAKLQVEESKVESIRRIKQLQRNAAINN